MNLETLVKNLDDFDENLTIFQKDKLSIESDIELFDNTNIENKVTKNGIEYVYLIELYLAKEFILDWINSLKAKPTHKEIAERLFEYAVNDA